MPRAEPVAFVGKTNYLLVRTREPTAARDKAEKRQSRQSEGAATFRNTIAGAAGRDHTDCVEGPVGINAATGRCRVQELQRGCVTERGESQAGACGPHVILACVWDRGRRTVQQDCTGSDESRHAHRLCRCAALDAAYKIADLVDGTHDRVEGLRKRATSCAVVTEADEVGSRLGGLAIEIGVKLEGLTGTARGPRRDRDRVPAVEQTVSRGAGIEVAIRKG